MNNAHVPPAPTPKRRRNTTNRRVITVRPQTGVIAATGHAPTVTITRPPGPPTNWWKVARRTVLGYRVGNMIGEGIMWVLDHFRKRANA